jgi:Family of unknown function (DUF6165)
MTSSKDRLTHIRAPIAVGELIDKITILEIKAERIADNAKRRNVANELTQLNEIKREAGLDTPEMAAYARDLKQINMALWDIEDQIRELETRKDFGARFIELARSVYQSNDGRARTKHAINAAFGSDIVEEKSYRGG